MLLAPASNKAAAAPEKRDSAATDEGFVEIKRFDGEHVSEGLLLVVLRSHWPGRQHGSRAEEASDASKLGRKATGVPSKTRTQAVSGGRANVLPVLVAADILEASPRTQ